MPQYRQMPVADAANWIFKSLTVEYRRLCLAHWRKLYGDQYADDVLRLAKKLYIHSKDKIK